MLSSCASVWDWSPDPYMGDHEKQGVVNAKGQYVLANNPYFSEMTCFNKKDIVALKANIERVKRGEARVLEMAGRKCDSAAMDKLIDALNPMPTP